uniref:Maturation n=1 Tax=Leviviridae sp. TaxID=2027243 RepID=A0A514DCN4_9VIRU|nr:MAG: hypothetical protein H2RhizoLitter491512_000003 [Leviviridae sp.]
MSQKPTSRSRKVQLQPYHNHIKIGQIGWKNGRQDYYFPVTDKDTTVSFPAGSQVTTSEGHPWRGRSNSPSFDVGGPFTSTKRSVEFIGNSYNDIETPSRANGDDVYYHFRGHLMPSNPSGLSFPGTIDSSDTVLSNKGAVAVSRCSPTNPVANLATFLGELAKDGIPAIPGSRTWEAKALALKNAGDEFLNVVFGWEPLKSDVLDTAKAVSHADSVLKQFERDAGKMVRRAYTFDTVVNDGAPQAIQLNDTPYIGVDSSGILWNAASILGTGTIWRTNKTVRRMWFSGGFTYHLPTGYVSRKKLKGAALEAKRVFGLDLTPEVLYNLAPWSWALDWITNVGDVIHNITQYIQYGQVMRYGYIMENTISTDIYSYQQTGQGDREITRPVLPMMVLRTETKKRRGANPFGFGLTWDGLTATQQAIAAALGLSHSRN